MKSTLLLALLCALLSTLRVSAQEIAPPRSVQVSGHQEIKPGEHPRLFFRKQDVPALRKRAQTPEGKLLIERLRATLGGGEAMPEFSNPNRYAYDVSVSLPEGAYSVSHAAGFGLLYQLTGDQKYADLAKQCIELGMEGVRDRDPDARYAIYGAHGELRLGPSLGWTAVAYDLCYDGWAPAFRKKVADYILDYEVMGLGRKERLLIEAGEKVRKQAISFEGMATKPSHHPGSNHFGSITGGTGLALLALKGDPEASGRKIDDWLARTEKNAVRALAGFGPRGFFFEGQGPSHMGAYPAMLSFFRALKNVTGRDYITPNEKMHWISLRWIGEVTNTQKGEPVYLARHEAMGQQYGSDILITSGGFSDNGRFSLGFGALPEKYHPHFLRAYNQYFKDTDGGRLDTLNYPHLAISAFLHWPIGVKPQSPQGVIPTAYRDQQFGHYVFRNGWNGDHTDVVVTAFSATKGGSRQKPWQGLPLKVRAFGKKHEIDLNWRDKNLEKSSYETDGVSSSVTWQNGTMLATDFSDRSGAAGVVVYINGQSKGPSFDSGYFPEFMHHKVGEFFVLTINPSTQHPAVAKQGDGLQIGGLIARKEGNQIVFSKADQPLGMIDSFEARGIDPLIDGVTAETKKHPGKPDALLSFDYSDFRQKDGTAYWAEAFGRGEASMAYNLRPEHLVEGVYGQAMQFRGSGLLNSALPETDSEAESKVEHPLGFKGIKTAVMLPDGDEWNMGGRSQILNFWLRLPETKSGYSMILEPTDKGPYHLGFHPGPTLMIGVKLGGLNAPFPNVPNVWHMVTLVRDVERGLITYFVNSELAGRAKLKGKSPEIPGPTVLFGRKKAGGRYPTTTTDGDLDEYAIFDRALTSGEIAALYEAGQTQQASLTGKPVAHTGIAAYIDADQNQGMAPLSVSFSSARSMIMQPGGDVRYAWDFGDGNTSTEANPSHVFEKDGLYAVRLQITDGHAQSRAEYSIRVANRAPLARLTQVSASGNAATLSASESKDPDGKSLQFAWSGAGQRGSGETFALNNIPPGSHIVTLSVTDTGGARDNVQTVVSVPDAQGFRLPENPSDVVPGLHYSVYNLFREPKGSDARAKVDPTHIAYSGISRFDRQGIVNQWAFNSLTPMEKNRLVVFSGFIDIPKDDTYTVHLDGVKNCILQIGSDWILASSASFDRPNLASKPIKLRKGKHSIRLTQPTTLVSKNAAQNYFFSRVSFENSQGKFWSPTSKDFFRSPLGQPGFDRDRIGAVKAEAIPMAAGNNPPEVKIDTTTESEMPGAKTVTVKAVIKDADGDALSVRWYTPEGSAIDDAQSLTRLLTAGQHVFAVEVSDGRGGLTRSRAVIDVPAWKNARSLSFEFTALKGRQRIGSVFPGDQMGIVPSAQWNMVGRTEATVTPLYNGSKESALWRDSGGKTHSLEVTFPNKATGSLLPAVHGELRHSPVVRFFASGYRTDELKISNIPYKNYDVVLYLMGDGTLATSTQVGESIFPTQEEGKRKKSKKKKGKKRTAATDQATSTVLKVQDHEITLQPSKHHRWNGSLTLYSESNPGGNVLIIENLQGSTCSFQLPVAIAGFQIVERD